MNDGLAEVGGEMVRFPSGPMFVGAVALAAVVLLWWFFVRPAAGDRRQAIDGPWRLFFSLCRGHRLRWADWRLLRNLALFHRLDEPARLFLEPTQFDVADGFSAKSAARLAAIKKQLFVGQDG